MSKASRDSVERARRRARRKPGWREHVINGTFWTGTLAWILEQAGWLPDLPLGLLFATLTLVGTDAITLPFRRRVRPLLLPGMRSMPLVELTPMPAESHVHVRGRIRALEPMATYLGQIDDAVYSHIQVIGTTRRFLAYRDFRKQYVEARDFLLVDESGATIEIRMQQAEVKLPRRMFYLRDSRVAWALLRRIPCERPSELAQPTITEHWLADGDEIEVMGTVERVADPRQEALPRELPTRPVLVSIHGRPLTVQLLRPR